MIKAIIFDFFSVLAVRDSASFRKTFYPDDAGKTRRTKQVQDELGRGLIGYDDYVTRLGEIGGVDRLTVLKYTEDYRANTELLDYIRTKLKPKYKIGIVSNAGQDWVLKILGKDGLELFDDVVLSYKISYIKPEPQIYELSAKNLGVNQEECIFVDDILAYCQGAERVGMSTIWYKDFEQMREELEALIAPVADN
jgi:HAD superfamily hydrolase (TIGR01509 family)